MIGYIGGKVLARTGDQILLRPPSGVGYFVIISPISRIMVNDQIDLFILEAVKDGASELYGFESLDDRDFVTKLLKVNGVGPKMAANIMYSLGISEIRQAIMTTNYAQLSSNVKGLGAKTAKKIILELKEDFIDLRDLEDSDGGWSSSQISVDYTEALANLGFKRGDIVASISKLKKQGVWDENDISTTIKAGLKILSKK